MINFIVRVVDNKLGVILHPRFVISCLALGSTLLLFTIVLIGSSFYKDSIKTIGPQGEEAQAEYDYRMKNVDRFVAPRELQEKK